MPMPQYARERMGRLLGHLVFAVHHANERLDANAIHDLRVAIRRFTQGLRVFAEFLPRRRARKIRGRLRTVLHLAGAVRNCDIALELIGKAGDSIDARLSTHFLEERRRAEAELADALRRWDGTNYSAKWRDRLRLHES
jgi:CHAD domain-containing protein